MPFSDSYMRRIKTAKQAVLEVRPDAVCRKVYLGGGEFGFVVFPNAATAKEYDGSVRLGAGPRAKDAWEEAEAYLEIR